jgi:hypothetical protein
VEDGERDQSSQMACGAGNPHGARLLLPMEAGKPKFGANLILHLLI